MLPRCGWGASICWPGAAIGRILKIKAHNSWPIRMVKNVIHSEDAAAVLEGSGALPFRCIFFVNFSSAISKEQRLELATSVFLLGHWYVDARFGLSRHSNVTVEPDAIFVHDGPVWTSAGVTSA
jgi:hypothetical protein